MLWGWLGWAGVRVLFSLPSSPSSSFFSLSFLHFTTPLRRLDWSKRTRTNTNLTHEPPTHRHRLRIEILPLPFAGTRYCGEAREESEEGDGETEEGSKEREAFRRGVSFLRFLYLRFRPSRPFTYVWCKENLLTFFVEFFFGCGSFFVTALRARRRWIISARPCRWPPLGNNARIATTTTERDRHIRHSPFAILDHGWLIRFSNCKIYILWKTLHRCRYYWQHIYRYTGFTKPSPTLFFWMLHRGLY